MAPLRGGEHWEFAAPNDRGLATIGAFLVVGQGDLDAFRVLGCFAKPKVSR